MERNAGKKSLNPPSELHPTHFPVPLHATGGNLVFFSLTRGKWRSMGKESLPLRYGESREIQSTNQGTPPPPQGSAGFDPSIADAE